MERFISIAITTIVIIILGIIFGTICANIYNNVSYGEKVGTIVDKQYHSAYTTTSYTTSYVGNSTIKIPTQQYHPETYNIKIEKQIEGKVKSIWIEVTLEEYSKFKIGDYYGR